MSTTARHEDTHGEMLVALMNSKRDLDLALNDKWYRVPVESAPQPWPPKWLALYQTAVFGAQAFAVRYYGQIADIVRVTRRELLPREAPNPKSDREYYKLSVVSMDELLTPIRSRLARSVVFIPTTLERFHRADELNDLFNDSPIENHLWDAFKASGWQAERQWLVESKSGARYFLDFALFCANGDIAVETDGAFHHTPARAAKDNERDFDIQRQGYRTIHFTTREVMDNTDECLYRVRDMAEVLGGFRTAQAPFVVPPKRTVSKRGLVVEQGSLFAGFDDDSLD